MKEKRGPGRPKKKHAGGRPTKFTPETVKKLEEAFLMGCSDLEACLVADISKTSLYNYQNANPEFVERKEKLKETPILNARQCVINEVKSNPDMALKYLERKRKKEFSLRQEQVIGIGDMDEFEKMTDKELDAELKKYEDTNAKKKSSNDWQITEKNQK